MLVGEETCSEAEDEPSEVAEILQEFENTNVEQFALAPTMIGPRPQLVSST
jgi:hypothetical protein